MLNTVFRRAAPRARARLSRRAVLWACAWALCAPAAHAAGPSRPSAPAPFAHYQGWRDEPLQDWRAANDRVGEIGGWRTYLRESQPAESNEVQRRQGDEGPPGHQGMEVAP